MYEEIKETEVEKVAEGRDSDSGDDVKDELPSFSFKEKDSIMKFEEQAVKEFVDDGEEMKLAESPVLAAPPTIAKPPSIFVPKIPKLNLEPINREGSLFFKNIDQYDGAGEVTASER
jgi:hypothetical protein